MIEKLLVRLIGDGSSFRTMMTTASAQAKVFEKNLSGIGRGLQNLGSNITKAGKVLTVGLTLPIAAMGGAGLRSLIEFDDAMKESTAIMSLQGDQYERMQKLALDLSTTSIQGPTELAKAYYFLASAGLDAENSMKALPSVAQFAAAGAFDMALATDLLTDAQSALGLVVKDNADKNLTNMLKVSDELVKANTLANASVEFFSKSLTTKAGSAIKSYNVELEDGLAILSAYADQGIKAELAGNMFSRMIRLLTQTVRENADEFEKRGISVFEDGEFRKFALIIGDMEKALGSLSTQEKAAALEALGFKARVQDAILPLLQTSASIDNYRQRLGAAGGTTQTVANNQLESLKKQLQITKNLWKATSIELQLKTLPLYLQLVSILQSLILQFRSLSPEQINTMVQSAMLAAALGPLLLVGGKLVSVFGFIVPLVGKFGVLMFGALNPVLGLVLAIGALIGGLRMIAGSWSGAGQIAANAIDMMADHVIVGIRIMIRAFSAFSGWMFSKFLDLWTVDWIKAITDGIWKADALLAKFFNWVIAKAKALFTGSEVGGLGDILDLGEDTRKAMEEKDLLASLKRITSEEMATLKGLREGKSLLTPEARANLEPIQTKVMETRDKATGEFTQIVKGIQEMVALSKQEAGKPTVKLTPLALNAGGT